MNKGNQPTFKTNRASSFIDLTIGNSKGYLATSNWRVDTSDSMSDHRYIKFNISTGNLCKSKARINPRTLNVTKYRKLIEEKLILAPHPGDGEETIDKMACFLDEIIMTAARVSCRRKTQRDMKANLWWNDDLEELRKELKVCTDPVEKVTLKRNFKKEIKHAKQESWDEFCSEMKDISDVSKIYKAKNGTQDDIGFIKNGERYTTSSEETLKTLVDAHNEDNTCPSKREIKRYQANYHLRRDTIWSEEWYKGYRLDSEVTIEKVRKAIKSFKPYKTPNGTGIYPKFLYELPDKAVLYFTIIVLKVIKSGYTPKTWLHMIMANTVT